MQMLRQRNMGKLLLKELRNIYLEISKTWKYLP